MKRPWWKRKRWAAALLLWLVAAYPLSAGPACYAEWAGWLREPLADAFRPVQHAPEDTAAGRCWNAYIDWWRVRGLDRSIKSGDFLPCFIDPPPASD
jgi:hypothetical protein